MSINYHNRKFRLVTQDKNGELDEDTTFHYQQKDDILTAHYSGGQVISGHLIGLVDDRGHIVMRYHQINQDRELMTGKCQSTPEILPNGKIRLYERWKWTSGNKASGESVVEEI